MGHNPVWEPLTNLLLHIFVLLLIKLFCRPNPKHSCRGSICIVNCLSCLWDWPYWWGLNSMRHESSLSERKTFNEISIVAILKFVSVVHCCGAFIEMECFEVWRKLTYCWTKVSLWHVLKVSSHVENFPHQINFICLKLKRLRKNILLYSIILIIVSKPCMALCSVSITS